MKILVTSTFITPFITDDLTLLRKHYDVEHMLSHGFLAPLSIARAVRDVDLVFTWFASTYAAAAVYCARRAGKKSLIAIGGADVAALPEIGYGIWLSPWKARLVGYALRTADRVLAVDPFLKEQARLRAGYDGRNIEYLPTGFDSSAWSPEGAKERMVMTVAVCDTDARLKVKGIGLLFDAARLLPDVPFLLIGIDERLRDVVRRSAPANVDVRGRVDRGELLTLYRRALVYCQPSMIEGLPGAVCEAMLCGCIPVATDVGGMRTAIGDAGFLVPAGDAPRLADGILKAMNSLPVASTAARDTIASRFTRERREEGLRRVIGEMLT